jgi:hypothetical protein
MSTTNASILVAGGGVTVLACPMLATLVLDRGASTPTEEASVA